MANQVKTPPHSEEVEASLLGALLINRDAIVEVAEFLKPEFFYRETHGHIYKACLKLYEAREPIDVVTVAEELKKQKVLKKIGGVDYLTDLIDKVPTAAHTTYYAKTIKALATRRSLIGVGADLNEMAFDEARDIDEIMDRAEQSIFAMSQQTVDRVFIPIKSALAESFDRLDELYKHAGGLRGIPTGFKDLDDTLAGMQDSNLIILAARPGMGKTAFALNIAHYAAMQGQVPVGIFSLEMSKEELVDRLLVSQADIDAWRLKTGRLEPDDFSRLSDAMGVLADAPIYIDDTPGLSVLEMRTKARRLKAEHNLKLLVVDYLQLIRGRGLENRNVEVGEISQGLKNLARELKIPVLSLAQLSRAIEHRGTKVPQLADLRESGSIEQDADVVMFLYRENDDDLSAVKLGIAKHRNGGLRTIDLFFKGDRIKFYGMERAMAGA